MRILSSSPSALLALLLAAVTGASAKSSSAAAAASTPPSTTVTLQLGLPQIPPGALSAAAKDPASLDLNALMEHIPVWTRASLESGGGRLFESAPVTQGGQFVFGNVTAGSYLGEIHCSRYFFGPIRVDVEAAAADSGALSVTAFESYRGNSWSNKGEALPVIGDAFVVKPTTPVRKNYYTERSTFSVLGILKNPMILIGLVTMGIVFGMPYLIDNMDPEMKAEWEERQKSGGVLGGGGGSAPPGANFDMAAFLAGSKPTGSSSTGSGSGSGSAPKSQGGGGVKR